jgi:16S rRNA processing protein RimM
MVELWTNREERMAPGAGLTAGDRQVTIEFATRRPDVGGRARWLVTFDQIRTHDDAEAMRGAVVRADPIEADGALWVHELIGSELVDVGGAPVGRVGAVEANPASDLLVLDDGRLVPLTFVTRDDAGRLVVEGPPGLLDP